ncbi:MAG: serine/threonine protein kinase, partial [Deltaproteobacteria bacterium]|nr:serine/threonine protein kinase [Deltaproteobacteria bacterium]
MAKDDHNSDTVHPEQETSQTTSSLPRGTNLGRFVVLEQIGAGGMGVVYSAYDSVLDRKVAVKLLRFDCEGEAAAVRQDRLMREARAMAQLAHPNVNTVFDVGTYRGQVFVAMELIDGLTLTGWLQQKTRSVRQILDVFLQAGRGLAAAHRASLIHRDVKPDNLLIGNDGRVRVTDFGLVASHSSDQAPGEKAAVSSQKSDEDSESLTQTGAAMGSPAYMSPEQHRGEVVSVSSDQFSFCVALFEALYGKRPFSGDSGEQLAANVIAGSLDPSSKSGAVPAWVRQIVLRGLRSNIADRFSSMDALLAALGKDPARKRRAVTTWIAVIIALAAGSWSLYTVLTAEKPTACQDSERYLAGVWDATRKQAVKSAFTESKRPYAKETFEKVKSRLDEYTGRWMTTRKNSCEATHIRGDQSDTIFELRKQCLDRRLSELNALIGLFAAKSDPKVLDMAVKATYELTPLAICSDVEFLKARIPLPENPGKRKEVQALRKRIDQAGALKRVGKHKDILEEVKIIASAAGKLDHPAILADALWLLGDLQSKTNEVAAAEETLYDAGRAAARARDDRLQARILTRLIYVIGNLKDRRQAALALAPAARMAIARAGGDDLLQANLTNHIGVVLDSDGRYAESVEHHHKSLELFNKALGEQHLRIATAYDNLGVALKGQGKYDEAIENYLKAHAIREKILDKRHPDIGNSLNNLGVVFDEKGDDKKAIAYYRQALEIWTKALGTDNPRVAMATNNIGSYYEDHAQYEEALDYFKQSLDIRIRLLGEKHQYTLRVRENIAITHETMGKLDQAFEEFREILKLNEEVLGAEHPGVAFTSNRIGNCHLKRKEYNKAIAAYQRALAIYEKANGPKHISLAEPLNNLGRVYSETHKLKLARSRIERALDIVRETFNDKHAGFAEVLISLARVMRLEGKPQKALEHLNQAMPILEKKLGDKGPIIE